MTPGMPPPGWIHRPATAAAVPAPAEVATRAEEAAGSRLIVGPNIKLKGVEIDDCDTLVVEGRVEATKVIDDSGDKKRGEKTAAALQSTARFRPRLENGEPVVTPGVQFSQPWILLLPAPATPAKDEKN